MRTLVFRVILLVLIVSGVEAFVGSGLPIARIHGFPKARLWLSRSSCHLKHVSRLRATHSKPHTSPTSKIKSKSWYILGASIAVSAAFWSFIPNAWASSPNPTAIASVADPRRVIALLLASSAFGLWAEENTKLGSIISGAMMTFFSAMLFSAVRLLPSSTGHPVYEIVWTHLVPMAVCQLMLSLDRESVQKSARLSGSMLLAFLIASIGTFVGCLLAHSVLVIPAGWQLASVFCATYIGGTLNFIATAEAVKLQDPETLATSFSVDMLMMAVYFSVLFFIARRPGVDADAHDTGSAAGHLPSDEKAVPATAVAADTELQATSSGFVSCLASGAALVWVSYGIAGAVGGIGGIPIVTALALIAACVFPSSVKQHWGGFPQLISTVCSQAFFAVIGASTDVSALLSAGSLLPLLGFVTIILCVHGLALELIGRRLLGLKVVDLVLASNAAVGGPATAAAMAGAMKWTSKGSPAVLCGTLGYAVGTYAGLLAGFICKSIRP